MIKKTSTS